MDRYYSNDRFSERMPPRQSWSINRSALGTLASTIRVAFLDLNASYVLQSQLPVTGNAYASYTLGTVGRMATEEISSDIDLIAYPNPVSSRYLNVESSRGDQ